MEILIIVYGRSDIAVGCFLSEAPDILVLPERVQRSLEPHLDPAFHQDSFLGVINAFDLAVSVDVGYKVVP